MSSPRAPDWGRHLARWRSCAACCSAQACRWCSTPTRSTRSTEAPELLVGPEGRDVIITPHPGELARLVGVTTADVQANRIEVAQGFAETHQLYVVLKGHRSIIATPEGRVFVNPTGNPGMATGGMGDLLTGMIAAWLAQLLDAEAACKLAVYLHGLAGDLAEAAEGEVALTPSDVVAQLGDAVLELTARRKVEKKE